MNWKAATGGLALVILFAALFLKRSGSNNAPTAAQANPNPIPPNLEQKEAPMLEKLVAAGRLPPLSERLPKNPAIVEPANELGRYGGVWRRIALGSGMAGMARIIYDPALRWSADGMEIQPNMCWKYEVSDDHRKFTFFLREGVRWSDGHPLTTEDVQFWWEDYILNKDIYPLTPTWIQINGKLPTLEIPGPYKFRLMFPHPYALFLERVAWQGNMWMPKHYLKQFHEKYRPKRELEAQAGAAGFRMWFQLFEDKASWGTNFEVPLTTAWVPKNKWSSYPQDIRAQSLFLESRHRRPPAALYRPGHARHPPGPGNGAVDAHRRRRPHAKPLCRFQGSTASARGCENRQIGNLHLDSCRQPCVIHHGQPVIRG